MDSYLKSWIYDPKTGLILRERDWERSNSLTLIFMQIMTCQWANIAMRAIDVTNTDKAIAAQSTLRFDGGANVTNIGMVIGTGTNATAITDYALQTQVTTNVEHSACSNHFHYDTDYLRYFHMRSFINTSGSDIAVTELAMYGWHGSGFAMCADRSLYSVTLPNRSGLRIQWKFEIRKRD